MGWWAGGLWPKTAMPEKGYSWALADANVWHFSALPSAEKRPQLWQDSAPPAAILLRTCAVHKNGDSWALAVAHVWPEAAQNSWALAGALAVAQVWPEAAKSLPWAGTSLLLLHLAPAILLLLPLTPVATTLESACLLLLPVAPGWLQIAAANLWLQIGPALSPS